ncbi:E3 ubiquitin-protein ligase AMFR-like [Battus philenor]|uniref:E3 ubiquitin-protein ligase AMFR-like n=1 Tax=Battus philenor TaxID=42288 RepID=UPI0035CED094
MPVTLVDRLPLPNLKVYSAGSVLLLSVAMYYAVSVTNDPNWRTNATMQRQEAVAAGADGAASQPVPAARAPLDNLNDTRNMTEQIVEVMTFMMQEPLCMWTVVNMAYCALAVAGSAVQRLVFGRLRVAEAQRVKDKFWNYVFYKFIFVFGVVNVQYMDEVLLWCSWFTLVGCLHLLGQLCKDRFEYLSSSPAWARGARARLLALLVGVLCGAGALLAAAARWALPAGRDTFAFMAAECVLVCVSALHVVAQFGLSARDADAAGPAAYYTHLFFDMAALVTELAHVAHMVVHSNALVSMASLVLLMQLRHLVHALLARLRRHRLYTALAHHMSRNYPMASKEEVEKNEDNCAICWEPMKEARKLPCAHLFHNSCLCRWVQQDASCPTCRRALAAGAGATEAPQPARDPLPLSPLPPLPPLPPLVPTAAPRPNHFFHFDGSRYVSWLPSFSVEVTRVRAEPPAASQLDAMARQVQQVFPQYSVGSLVADLARTRSPDLTVDNILAGRLPLRAHLEEPALSEPSASALSDGTAASSVTSSTSAGTDADASEQLPGSPDPAALHDDQDDHAEPSLAGAQFSSSAAERERTLRRRKEQLLAAARRRYLQREAQPAQRAQPAQPASRS